MREYSQISFSGVKEGTLSKNPSRPKTYCDPLENHSQKPKLPRN
jgi:hypothetical protein